MINSLTKNAIDIGESTLLGTLITNEFWQQILIALSIVLINAIVLPLLKKIMKKLGFNEDESEKIAQDVTDVIKKKIEEIKDDKDGD